MRISLAPLRSFLISLSVVAAILGFAGCGSDEPPPVDIQNTDFETAEKEAIKEYEE